MAEAVTEEEFQAWRDHPVTQYVTKAFEAMAAAQKKAWIESTWDGNHCDAYDLCALRTRADTFNAMKECTLADLVAAVEPEAE